MSKKDKKAKKEKKSQHGIDSFAKEETRITPIPKEAARRYVKEESADLSEMAYTGQGQESDDTDCLKLENQLCFPLYACAKEVVKRYRPLLEPFDLTYTQYIVMMVLWSEKHQCQNSGRTAVSGLRYAHATAQETGEQGLCEAGTGIAG